MVQMTGHKPEILVTGARGALAQQVISRLKHDYRIVAVDFREQPDTGAGMPAYTVDFNKRDFEDIFRKHEFKGVLHLGRIGANMSTPASRFNANVLGTQKMFNLCVKYEVKQVIVLSTFFVYGANAYNPALIVEEAPLKASGLTVELVDAVELENLSAIYLWKHPQLNVTILRPCNIAGQGVRNSMSRIMSMKRAPVMAGFSPMMQFIHIDDMADAIELSFRKNKSGIYNVAPDDWISYHEALANCGCKQLPLPSIPPVAPRSIIGLWKPFPVYMVNYLKYPVILNGDLFRNTFKFKPRRSLDDVFRFYREKKSRK